MKSDVIRKRARHDARRASGNSSETPSASPGASRRASPEGSTPTLAPDSTTQSSYSSEESEYRAPTQADIINAFAGIAQNQQNSQVNPADSYPTHMSYSLSYPGPYHPDHISYTMPTDALTFSQDGSDFDGSEGRSAKRRRLSNDSASETPSSATSFGYTLDSYSSASSTSQSQRSSLDYPFFQTYGLFRNQTNPSMWHPPMLPPDNSPQFVHPPMLPQEDSPMDYLQNMQHDDTDALFNTYLHPPMLPPEDSPKVSVGSLLPAHPPTLSHDWSTAYELHDNTMQAY